MSRPRTLAELKSSGYRPRSVKEELRANVIARLRAGSPLFPGTQVATMIKGKKVAWYEPQWRAKADEILKEILEATGLPVVR